MLKVIKVLLCSFCGTVSIAQTTFPNGGAPLPTGANTDVFYFASTGTLGSVANIETNDTTLILNGQSGAPTTSAANVGVYARNFGSETWPEFSLNHFTAPIQRSMLQARRREWRPHGANTSATTFGLSIATSGTTAAYAMTAGDRKESAKYVNYRTSATAGNVAGVRGTTLYVCSGASDYGGYYFCSQSSMLNNLATGRNMTGLHGASGAFPAASTAFTSLTDVIGLGFEHGATEYSIVHNDASGTATTIPLGSSFPTASVNVSWMILEIFCRRGASSVSYRVTNLKNGAIAQGSISTNLPSSTTLLTPITYCSNGTTASLSSMAIGTISLETY